MDRTDFQADHPSQRPAFRRFPGAVPVNRLVRSPLAVGSAAPVQDELVRPQRPGQVVPQPGSPVPLAFLLIPGRWLQETEPASFPVNRRARFLCRGYA